METVDSNWATDNMQSGLSSGEGLIWAVRDPIEKMECVRERGRPPRQVKMVVDDGVADKRLYVIETEFGQPLRVLKRDGNTLSPILRAVWDCENMRSLVKSSPVKATGAHISIVGHITQPELLRYLG